MLMSRFGEFRGQIEFSDIEKEFEYSESFIGLSRTREKITLEKFKEKKENQVVNINKILEDCKEYELMFTDGSTLGNPGRGQDRRQSDLKDMRDSYEYRYENGLPVTLKKLPEQEKFSFMYGLKIADILSDQLFDSVVGSTCENLSDFVKLCKLFWEPHEIDRWDDDEKFGLQRLLGVNSSVIRRVKDMKQLEKLHVGEQDIQPLLQGLTLKDAIKARQLFIVDHAILDKCPKSPNIILCSPIALFFLKEDKLMPVAIQLFQSRSDNNPVFFPTDDKYTWILAKMWFNNADAQIHQAISHLGYTHLIMEGFAIAAHRHLSKLHPIFKLLAPHFLYLMAINDLGLKELLAKGELIDKLMSMGSEGADYLIAKHKDTWRLNVEGCLPADIVDRGVEPTDVPFYPFRDDALLTYKAIEEYVDSCVSLFYRSDKVLIEDPEIQAWRYDMDRSASDGGLGVKGIPGEQGSFQKREELALVLKCIIYTCSVWHAAVNFKQYDEYALTLIGHPPKDKRERDLKEDAIPTIQPINKLLTLMGLTKVLSTRATNALGNFEVNYIHDPAAVELVEQFQKNLENTRKEIEKRNETRSAERAYPFLNPAEIPNAISI
ncbi:polyunsaturated fatty acid 5-lipoxygenase-like [Mya arenaria]|uniref:polyunsaturated fatty acid 5-lipoxygenase-like n=1 Tax=Mya arenaria TaxID=6604 RepID=UPI0022E0FD40|nr:polyunsaturated fatty acid 5-lipoxygenase-like [Mya arenaria]